MTKHNKIVEVAITQDSDFVLPISIAALNEFDMIAVTSYIELEDKYKAYEKACVHSGKQYYKSDAAMYFFQQHIKDAINEIQAMELSHQKAFINSDVSGIRNNAINMQNYTQDKLTNLDIKLAEKIMDWDSKHESNYEKLVDESMSAKTYEELSLIQIKLGVLDKLKMEIDMLKKERLSLVDQISKQNRQKMEVFKNINTSKTIDSSKSTIALVNIEAAKGNEHGKLDNFDKIVGGGDIISLDEI